MGQNLGLNPSAIGETGPISAAMKPFHAQSGTQSTANPQSGFKPGRRLNSQGLMRVSSLTWCPKNRQQARTSITGRTSNG